MNSSWLHFNIGVLAMAYETPTQVTFLLDQLRSGDEKERSDAKEALLDEYTKALLTTARSKLGPALIQRGTEPQAIVDTALRRFLDKPRENIRNRNSLWRFLVKVISRRCASEYRYQYADKRSPQRFSHRASGSPFTCSAHGTS
jgi:hypothetical protein